MSHQDSERPALLIVSDTAMRPLSSGQVEAFEPVIREVEHFEYLFSRITWIGYDFSDDPRLKNMRLIHSDKVTLIPLKRTGGKHFWNKFNIVFKMFPYFPLIFKLIGTHEVIHTRAPSMPAFLAILISFFKRNRIYWHKYAGSWDEPNPPRFYAFQRYLLKKAGNTHVTINGRWEKQEKHLLSFENPCLTEEEISWIEEHSTPRAFNGKLNFCFIGNIRAAKGMDFIVETFPRIDLSRVGKVHFIGDGEARPEYQKRAEEGNLPFVFHGFTLRNEMHSILDKCQFLLLPSKSEGFPKVIAEVSPYGIIPIVTAISSIPQYVHHGKNGFLVDTPSTDALEKTLTALLRIDAEALHEISRQAFELHRKFTYSYYNERIEREILEKEVT